MGRRDPVTPEYVTWNIDHDEYNRAEYVGVMGEGHPVFYDPEKRSTFRGRAHPEDERITPVEGSEESLGVEETVGEAIERLGEKTGWESLSEFAREHLESDDRKNESN
ncbi:hypothetical protein [Haladaptatus halobius]|jgi:hypothetical protein|uniref:hypothetical protein n=1 Tax=Haladaptatus halobius TaxID=2884875 RepID=UPI001D0B8FA6|nr:hypothetical protein [Haladaptatus halobius]